MKKKSAILIFLLSCLLLASCKKNNDENIIIGKWKLQSISIAKDYQEPEITDYSKRNIIYEFLENGKLVVTGSIPDLFIFDDFYEGEHFYEYQKPNVCPTCLPGPNLLIDTSESGQAEGAYYCLIDLSNKTMKIGNDGKEIEGVFLKLDKIFVKLNK